MGEDFLNTYLKKNRLPILTVHFDFPAVGFCHCLRNGKPDSGTACLLRAGIVRAVEAVEQPGKISGILQNAGVKNLYFGFPMNLVYIQADASMFIRIFQCIVKKNGNQLADGIWISA